MSRLNNSSTRARAVVAVLLELTRHLLLLRNPESFSAVGLEESDRSEQRSCRLPHPAWDSRQTFRFHVRGEGVAQILTSERRYRLLIHTPTDIRHSTPA